MAEYELKPLELQIPANGEMATISEMRDMGMSWESILPIAYRTALSSAAARPNQTTRIESPEILVRELGIAGAVREYEAQTPRHLSVNELTDLRKRGQRDRETHCMEGYDWMG